MARYRMKRPMFAVEDTAAADHGGDGVFENQLFLIAVFEQHGVFVEGTNLARKLDTADQVDGDERFVLANGIEEGVLNVLCRL